MDTGTGKTFAALEVIRRRNPTNVLILSGTKESLINWERHFVEYVNLSVSDGTRSNPSVIIGNRTRIVISTYRRKQIKTMTKLDLIILDESHNIKNRKSLSYKMVRTMVNKNPKAQILIMTATPSSLGSIDLWTQYSLLGAFNKVWKHFSAEWCEPCGFMDSSWRIKPEKEWKFLKIINQYTFYQDASILKLKKHTTRKIMIDLKEEEREIYNTLKEEFIIQFKDLEEVTPNALAQMSKLHQICGGVFLYEDQVYFLDDKPKLRWTLRYKHRR